MHIENLRPRSDSTKPALSWLGRAGPNRWERLDGWLRGRQAALVGCSCTHSYPAAQLQLGMFGCKPGQLWP